MTMSPLKLTSMPLQLVDVSGIISQIPNLDIKLDTRVILEKLGLRAHPHLLKRRWSQKSIDQNKKAKPLDFDGMFNLKQKLLGTKEKKSDEVLNCLEYSIDEDIDPIKENSRK